MNTGPIARFFRIAWLLMLLVAVGLLSAIPTMQFAIHGAEVQVPALKGMTTADARSVTAGLGLNAGRGQSLLLGRRGRGAHPVAIAGGGDGGAARMARARSRESWSRRESTSPTRWAQTNAWPRWSCAARDLRSAKIARLPYGSAAEGTVLAQDPPPHAQGIEQPSVSLLVAAPDDEVPDGYVMPDLTGWPWRARKRRWPKWESRQRRRVS